MQASPLSHLRLQEDILLDWLATSAQVHLWVPASQLALSFNCCTLHAKNIVSQFEIWEAKQRKALKDQRAAKLWTLRFQLQHNLQDPDIQESLRHIEQLIIDDEIQAAHIAQKQMHLEWLQDGECSSLGFFQNLKSRIRANKSLAIRD